MKKIIFYLIGIITLIINQSCSKNKQAMDEEVQPILGNLYKDVKYRDKAVNYHAEIQIGGCAFEVYVNDMSVYKYAGNDGSGSIGLSAPINTNVLKSGLQTWEIRIYPPEINGKRLISLPEGVKVELSIEELQFVGEDVKYLSQPVVLIETPKKVKDGKQIYADAGKPFMIYKGTFNAEVPYTLKGWSESVDLSKEDSTKLKEELKIEYEKFRGMLQNRELGKISHKIFTREKEVAQSLYYTKAMNQDFVETIIDRWGAVNLKMYPIENYKMVFSGNGKMVTLEKIIPFYVPALIGDSKQIIDGKEKTYYMTYYVTFHRPKAGKALEVIR